MKTSKGSSSSRLGGGREAGLGGGHGDFRRPLAVDLSLSKPEPDCMPIRAAILAGDLSFCEPEPGCMPLCAAILAGDLLLGAGGLGGSSSSSLKGLASVFFLSPSSYCFFLLASCKAPLVST